MRTMDEVKRQIREKEQARAALDKEISQLKIELADIVLSCENESRREPEESEKVTTFVAVRFNGRGKTYDYIWDGPESPEVGDTVQVETKWNGQTNVEVVSVFQKPTDLCDGDYKCAYPIE